MPRIIDLTGQRFGRLLVVGYSHSKGHAYWKCMCDCGIEKVVRASHLKDGTTVSCGCHGREAVSKANTTHGHTKSPTYSSWHSMMMRCHNPNAQGFQYWGGRGIKVCDDWQFFRGFLADMGLRPAHTTLDRIDPDGDYEHKNCRWASTLVQSRNKRKPSDLPSNQMNAFLGFGC